MSDDDIYDLPPPVQEVSASPLDSSRVCSKCGQEGRVVSNELGVNVFCNHCKTHWPVSMAKVQEGAVALMPRGLSKQTLVEPDTSIAFEDDEEETEHETRRWEEPKKG